MAGSGRGWGATLVLCVLLVSIVLVVGLVGGDAGRRSQPPLLGREQLERLSPFQRAIVQDGEITVDEYRAAIEATVACAREGGAVIDDPEVQADGTLSYSVGVRPAGGPDAVTAHSRCARKYSDEISVLWANRR
jgi:hypothetical protein